MNLPARSSIQCYQDQVGRWWAKPGKEWQQVVAKDLLKGICVMKNEGGRNQLVVSCA